MSIKRSASLTMAVPPELMDVMLPLLDKCRERGIRTSKRQAIGMDGLALAVIADFALKYNDSEASIEKAAKSIASSVGKVMDLPSVKAAGGVGRRLLDNRKNGMANLETVKAALAQQEPAL